MAKRGLFRNSMHIKQSTEGTSNEISFSVLDAKKGKSNETNPNSPRTVSELGKISLFTLPGKQGSDSLAPASDTAAARALRKQANNLSGAGVALGMQGEVATRKQRRRAWRLLNVAAVLAVLGLLTLVGGTYITSLLETQRTGAYALNDAIILLEQTDEAFVALDEAVMAPATAERGTYDQVLDDLAAAASLLDRAANKAEQAAASETDDATRETAAQVKESALTRKDLIEKGRTTLVQGTAAKTATELAQQAWGITLEADELARNAAALLEDDSAKNVAQSSALSTQAMDKFQEALVVLRQAKAAYPRADLSVFETYLEKRSAAQQNALASNDAIAEQDRVTAEANNAAYNTNEQEAASLAQSLPADPAQPIIDRYAEVGGASDDAYQQARARVARADAAVRAFREQ